MVDPQAITRAIADRSRTIRVPVHMNEALNKLTRTSRGLVRKIRKISEVAQSPVSLETSVGEEGDSRLTSSRTVVSFHRRKPSVNLKEKTESALKTLTQREEQVLKMRFGLEDGSERTLEEVGRRFSVTRERIHKIEAKALQKLRQYSHNRILRDFREDLDRE